MSIEVACGCGKVTTVPDEFGGRSGKCRSCGATIHVPQSLPIIDVEPTPAGLLNLVTEDRDEPDRSAVPRSAPVDASWGEPWYYRFLETYANGVFWLAVVQFAVAILAMALGMVNQPKEGPQTWLDLLPIGVSFAVLVSLWLASASVLVVVDIGRSLRVMAWKSR